MSTHSSTRDSPTTAADAQERNQGRLERAVPPLAGPIRLAGFWTAIVLPFLYVPLLVTGLSNAAETSTFLGLLIVNLIALYVGHSHRR